VTTMQIHEPSADPAQALLAIEAVLADQPQVQLDDRAAFQADQEAQFDSILIAVNGLLGLVLFIALLGIPNTLALSVMERTREIGLLRAASVISVVAIPYGTIAVIVIVAAVCGLVAGLLPARRAARLDVLRAIASE